MSGHRYDRILASTALALILAASIGASAAAQDGGMAAATPAAAPAEQQGAQSASAPAAEPSGAPAAPDAVAGAPDANPAAASAAPAPSAAEAAKDVAAPANPTVATEQTAPPDPMAALDPADRAVAEKIRDLLAAKTDKIFASKKERAAVEAFYQKRNLAPLWLDKGVENARAKAVIARLKAADADGLETSEYKIPTFAGLSGRTRWPKPSSSSRRRCSPTRATCRPGASPIPASAQQHRAAAGAARDGRGAGARSPTPPMPARRSTISARRIRPTRSSRRRSPSCAARPAAPARQIADGQLLKLDAKPPMEDPRVPLAARAARADRRRVRPQIRRQARRGGEEVPEAHRAAGRPAISTAKTIKELNGPPRSQQIDLIIANMERWRWYPRDLGAGLCRWSTSRTSRSR